MAKTRAYMDCPKPREIDRPINDHYLNGDYKTCFKGCMKLALKGSSLAQCQICYFYCTGEGTDADLKKALYWTKRAKKHGCPDADENLEEIRPLIIMMEPM